MAVSQIIHDALTAVFQAALNADVREARVRFTNDGTGFNNFVWIMVDRVQLTVEGSQEKVDGVWAHTNDYCFLTGSPHSFCASAPLIDTQALTGAAIAFVEEKMSGAQRVELLLQTSLTQGQSPNFIADSETGWEHVHEQPVHFTD